MRFARQPEIRLDSLRRRDLRALERDPLHRQHDEARSPRATEALASTVPAVGLIDVSAAGFAAAGENIQIFDLTRITSPERISLGSHVIVDDFVFIQGGQGARDRQPSAHRLVCEHSRRGAGVDRKLLRRRVWGARVHRNGSCRRLGTDRTEHSARASGYRADEHFAWRACLHRRQRRSPSWGATIGTGAVVGAGSVVTGDLLEPWTINVGTPCRTIRLRPSERILEYARRLTSEEST